MTTRYRRKLDEYERGHSQSTKDLWKIVRLMGDSKARVQFAMLHPDHIRWAAVVLANVAQTFEEIAKRKRTNIQKILEARAVLHMANRDLEKFAKDDIMYVQGLRVLNQDN